MMKVLLVEDDSLLAGRVCRLLSVDANISVRHVCTGRLAQRELESSRFDAVILDLTLPDIDGLQVLTEVRAHGEDTPIIILSARSLPYDKVRGLDDGADDYLTKPFEDEELLARLRTIVRRHAAAKKVESKGQGRAKFGDLIFDPTSNMFMVDEIDLELTKQLHNLLEMLMKRAGQVISKEQLMSSMCMNGDNTAVDRAASRLRRSLAMAGSSVTVRAAKGLGYSLSLSQDGN